MRARAAGGVTRSAKSGPLPFEADSVTSLDVEPTERGARLRVGQEGFPAGPEMDELSAARGQGRRDTFAGTRRHLGAAGSSG